MLSMRFKRRFFALLTLGASLLLAGGVGARDVLEGELCTIPAGTVVQGDAFVLCGDLVVEGRVEGHLLGAVRTAQINGAVGGSVYLVGGHVQVNGSIGKDLHFAGVALDINAGARFDQGGLLAASFSTVIAPGASINGSLITGAYQLIVDGAVDQDIHYWGSALELRGSVGGDVDATVGDSLSDGASAQIETLLIPLDFFGFDLTLVDPGLRVLPSAHVGGALTYYAPSPGLIQGGLGQTPRFISNAPTQLADIEQDPQGSLGRYAGHILREFATLALIGLLGLLVMPRQMQATLRPIQVHPISTVSVGMLSFILSFPIVLIIFLVSLLIVLLLNVLPLDELALFGAMVLGLANIGGAGLFYFTAIFIARVIVGLALGRFLLRLAGRDDGSFRSLAWSLLLGLLLLTIGGSLPVLGFLVYALSLFLGLGAILTVIRTRLQQLRSSEAVILGDDLPEYLAVVPVSQGPPPAESPIITEARLVEGPPGPGMEDLPPGFDFAWFDDFDDDEA